MVRSRSRIWSWAILPSLEHIVGQTRRHQSRYLGEDKLSHHGSVDIVSNDLIHDVPGGDVLAHSRYHALNMRWYNVLDNVSGIDVPWKPQGQVFMPECVVPKGMCVSSIFDKNQRVTSPAKRGIHAISPMRNT